MHIPRHGKSQVAFINPKRIFWYCIGLKLCSFTKVFPSLHTTKFFIALTLLHLVVRSFFVIMQSLHTRDQRLRSRYKDIALRVKSLVSVQRILCSLWSILHIYYEENFTFNEVFFVPEIKVYLWYKVFITKKTLV